jgi:L-ascorbate metabolism protein UlaG (beta-lactamase superfamily)
MRWSRRHALGLGATGLAGLGLTALVPFAARAQGSAMEGDSYDVAGGAVTVRPVEHASLAIVAPGMVIYADPVGDAAAYGGLPPPDLILVTTSTATTSTPGLAAVAGGNTRLLTNPAVHAMLPGDLQGRATAIANGEDTTANDIAIAAVPAYNTTPARLQYHPRGRDNGYVLTIGGRRLYIAGDTEDIPEMRALQGIDIAFVPMNLPYTMSVGQAAAGVAAFAPGIVYPYHYGESDVAAFARLLGEAGSATEVAPRDWYPQD